MEEVDNIIIHSLRQIGCQFDDDFNLASFTPESLVRVVATCLEEIKTKKATTNVPRTLPAQLAQRFATATQLAEICTEIGYRSDIGYQSFLYPNTVDVRRLLMFLIEQLPKDARSTAQLNQGPMSEYDLLQREIKEKLRQQLQAPWVPQYCRNVGNWRHEGCGSQHMPFQPHTNLTVLPATPQPKEVQQYLQKHAPNVFQQCDGVADVSSAVLHKNAIDLYDSANPAELMKLVSVSPTPLLSSVTASPTKSSPENAALKQPPTIVPPTPLEQLTDNVNELKCKYDTLLAERRATGIKITQLKSSHNALQTETDELRKVAKVHERTGVVLENLQENITKLETLVQSTQERRKTLEQQWQNYRQPMNENLQQLQTTKQARQMHNVLELRAQIAQLELEVREKTSRHTQLGSEFKNAALTAAPRKEYTRRIHEFIGNIRKQRNDIYKVLDDTRDLQKQLNSVSAQLQRQFTYTDELLFQSAKHDVHAKKAYKLLASLHTTCNDLIELVTQTGNLTKEIRDLEVQCDRERLKNIANSLARITADIQNFESVTKEVQAEIHKVENAIVNA